LEGGRIICVQQRFVFQLTKSKARVAITAECRKRNAGRTAQDQKFDLNNSDSGIQDLDTSEQEENEEISCRVKRDEGAGSDSSDGTAKECHMISNDGATGSELGTELCETVKRKCANNTTKGVQKLSHKSDTTEQKMKGSKKRRMFVEEIVGDADYEGSHMKRKRTTKDCHIISNDGAPGSEPETVLSKTLKRNCANNTSKEVQKVSCNSDVDAPEMKMKGSKKRQIYVEEINENVDYEGNHKKWRKTAVQNEGVEEVKGVDSDQLPRLSLTAGFVWDANPSLLPAATAAHKSDSSSDEEEVDKVGRQDVKNILVISIFVYIYSCFAV
jgi:hypothetical protein